jgi:hypothetical protein
MNFKTLSAVAVGATLVALDAHAAEASPKPADPFHWSTAIDARSVQTPRKVQYNRKTYVVPDNLAAKSFIDECLDNSDNVVRFRGFVNQRGEPEWSKAEVLCAKSQGGPELPPEFAQLPEKELKIFGRGPATLKTCEPKHKNSKRIWTECGITVPNDGTSEVRVGDGQNIGMVLRTASTGSGIDTVEPVLLPEVERMREQIFRDRLEAGYYNRAV